MKINIIILHIANCLHNPYENLLTDQKKERSKKTKQKQKTNNGNKLFTLYANNLYANNLYANNLYANNLQLARTTTTQQR